DAAGRMRDDAQDTVGPRDRYQLGVGIDSRAGPQVGLEVAAFLEIVRLARRAELRQAEHGGGVDHAGIEVEALGLDNGRALRGLELAVLNRRDLALLDKDGAID